MITAKEAQELTISAFEPIEQQVSSKILEAIKFSASEGKFTTHISLLSEEYNALCYGKLINQLRDDGFNVDIRYDEGHIDPKLKFIMIINWNPTT